MMSFLQNHIKILSYRVPLTFFLIVLLFSACGTNQNQLSGSWYYLHDGKFIQTDTLSALSETNPEAWQHQERIADIGIINNNPLFLINGYGVAIADVSENEDRFDYYFHDIFKNNTSTVIFENKGSIICHIYYDKAFRRAGDIMPETDPLCFVKISLTENKMADFQTLQSVFHKKNMLWEAVAAYGLNENSVVLELKRSESELTQFAYTVYHLDTGEETEKSREWFTESFQIQEINNTPIQDASLSQIFEDTIKIFENQKKPVILHFNIRNQISHTEKRFRFSSADSGEQVEFKKILIVEDKDHYIALLPNGIIFLIDKKNPDTITKYQLPPMPEYHEYTSFISIENKLYIVWEESDSTDFYKIRKSGFLKIELVPQQ